MLQQDGVRLGTRRRDGTGYVRFMTRWSVVCRRLRPELAKTTAGDEPSGIEPRITKGQQLCEVKDEMVSRVPEVEDRME